MLAETDYVAIGTLITAIGTAIVGIIVAWRQTGTNAKVDNVHAQVETQNGRTIGEIVEANDLAAMPDEH